MRKKSKTPRFLTKFIAFAMTAAFALSSAVVPVSAADDYDPDKIPYRSVMYYGDWSIWGGQNNHYPKELPVENYTHLNFAFMDFDANANLMFTDEQAAVGAPVGMNGVQWDAANAGCINAFQDLRARNPHLRIGLSVGGWSKSGDFSVVCASDTLRAKLVANLVKFVKYANMDYVDVDWEYPGDVRQPDLIDNSRDEGTPNARPEDKQNYVKLLRELRVALDAQGEELGKVYELSIAAPAPKARLDAGFDIPAMMQVLDFVNIMTYDMHGAWNGFSGHQTALYTNPADPLIDQGLSVDASVKYLISLGAIPKKLTVGYALYSRGWELVNETDGGATDGNGQLQPGLFGSATLIQLSGAHAPAYGAYNLAPIVSGDGGHASGVWSYGTLDQLRARYSGLTEYWDDIAKAPYLYKPSGAFFTFDNVRSVQEKVAYVKANGLGGMIGWMASQDKTTGTGKRDELSRTVRDALGLFVNGHPTYNISDAAIDVSATVSAYTENNRNGFNITLKNNASITESDAVLNKVEIAAETIKNPRLYIKLFSESTMSTGGYGTGTVSNQNGWCEADMSVVYDNQTINPGATVALQFITSGPADVADIECIMIAQRITGDGPEISKQCIYHAGSGPIVNQKPVITGADNVTIQVGTPFDPLEGVTASDQKDGDLTSAIVVTGTVDSNTEGVYRLTYSVTDSDNQTTTVDRTVTVVDGNNQNTLPVITGVANKTITVGDAFNPMQGVSASDAEDGNLTSAIVVTGSVNTAVAGTYPLTYTVTDSNGGTATASCVVTVEPEEEAGDDTYDPNKPYNGGDTVTYNGDTYRAKWWTQGGGTPDVNPAWEKISGNEDGDIEEYNPSKEYQGGDQVTYQGQVYEAKWWTKGETPGSSDVWRLVG